MCTQVRKGLLFLAILIAAAPGVSARVWLVDAAAPGPHTGGGTDPTDLTWTQAYLYLEDALSAAQSGDEIWVARGATPPAMHVYTPRDPFPPSTDPRRKTFLMKSGVAVYGGFLGTAPGGGETIRSQRNPEANPTVLSGDLDGDDDYATFPEDDEQHTLYGDNVFHVVTFNNTNPNTKLSGFVVRGGFADGAPNGSNENGDDLGGGVFIAYEFGISHATGMLNRNVVEYNYATHGGAGIYIAGKEVVYVTNCTMKDNRVLEGFGAGLWVNFAHFYENLPVAVQNCVFVDNHIVTGTGAGMAVPNVALPGSDIVNCTFYHNTYENGPFQGYTLAGAFYVPPNGGQYEFYPTAIIKNCIVWGNTAPQLGRRVDACYSDVEDASWVGASDPNEPTTDCLGSSTTVDPLFRDAGNRILRVRHCSPVIDLGFDPMILPDGTDVNDNSTPEAVTPWDRDRGGPRVLNVGTSVPQRTVDMGAWEECIAGDIDGNGVVELSDLTQLLACFGTLDCTATPPCCIADITNGGALCWDGVVDISDLTLLLSQFGLACTSNLTGGGGEPGGESMMSGDDPLNNWLRSATPEEVLDWWYAGMPPVEGDER